MTDKEFKRLKRSELIEIIYQLQLDVQKMNEENAALKVALESKELKISNAGSIAEAAIGLFGVFNKAQEAADLYLSEIYRNNAEIEAAHKAMIADAENKAEVLRRKAESDVASIHKEAEDARLQAQADAKRIVDEAEQTAAAKMEAANSKIEQMLRAHAELSSFLKR